MRAQLVVGRLEYGWTQGNELTQRETDHAGWTESWHCNCILSLFNKHQQNLTVSVVVVSAIGSGMHL